MSENAAERRQHERFRVHPMYTPVCLRTLDTEAFAHEGHAYDLSEGGMQLELDRGIDPGTPVAVQVSLPPDTGDIGPGRSVFIFGTVVWLADDEPGPARLAVAFRAFARMGDRDRLLRAFGARRARRAA